jgi:2-haloacid dehalogenase
MAQAIFPRAVLFDLLTALLDSWTIWNAAAGSPAMGKAWRAEYLRLTYGCGAYVPYEQLVREAARTVGLADAAAVALEARWPELAPWSGVPPALEALRARTKLAIVTNCSRRLGLLAAARLNVRWDCVMTAKEAGYYKPDPRPYRLALATIGVHATEAVFVAGSGYDLFGTSALGMRSYWRNHTGLARPIGAPAADFESPTIESLLPWLEGHLS